jgi:hypothetical protein
MWAHMILLFISKNGGRGDIDVYIKKKQVHSLLL